LDTTTWRYPVPSRSATKAILPLERVGGTHPRTVTAAPTCSPSASILV
jgi:hypothetical protein